MGAQSCRWEPWSCLSHCVEVCATRPSCTRVGWCYPRGNLQLPAHVSGPLSLSSDFDSGPQPAAPYPWETTQPNYPRLSGLLSASRDSLTCHWSAVNAVDSAALSENRNLKSKHDFGNVTRCGLPFLSFPLSRVQKPVPPCVTPGGEQLV